MGYKAACCFGHRDLHVDVTDELKRILEDLIVNEGIVYFTTGGMGAFDRQFAATVRGLKETYPQIRLFLVIPYITKELTTNCGYYREMYDEIILPQSVDATYHKGAIAKRNQWMATNTDYVISYVQWRYGGAYAAVKYAKRIGKNIISLVDMPD